MHVIQTSLQSNKINSAELNLINSKLPIIIPAIQIDIFRCVWQFNIKAIHENFKQKSNNKIISNFNPYIYTPIYIVYNFIPNLK